MITILMMSAKMAILGLLKLKVLWGKGYDVVASVHYVTKKILSYDLNYILSVAKWPKFGNSSIPIREVMTNSIL